MLKCIFALSIAAVDATVLYFRASGMTTSGGEPVLACTVGNPGSCQDIALPSSWKLNDPLNGMTAAAMTITNDSTLHVGSAALKIYNSGGSICESSGGGSCGVRGGWFKRPFLQMNSMAAVGNNVYVADFGLRDHIGQLYTCSSAGGFGSCRTFLEPMWGLGHLKFRNDELIFSHSNSSEGQSGSVDRLGHWVIKACTLSGDCKDIDSVGAGLGNMQILERVEATKDFVYTVFGGRLRARNRSSGEYRNISLGPTPLVVSVSVLSALVITEEAIFVTHNCYYDPDHPKPCKVVKCNHGSSTCTEIMSPVHDATNLAVADGMLYVANVTSIAACPLAGGDCHGITIPEGREMPGGPGAEMLACETCQLQDAAIATVV